MVKTYNKNESRVRRHKRVRAKISGTATTPRLCLYRSNKHIEAQIIDDVKQVTLVSSSSIVLKLENGSNVEAAGLVGQDIAKKALAAGIENDSKVNSGNIIIDNDGYVQDIEYEHFQLFCNLEFSMESCRVVIAGAAEIHKALYNPIGTCGKLAV